MTLTQIFIVLRARWLSALVMLVTVASIVMAVTMAMPKRYTAAASILLDVKSPDPIAGMVLPGMTVSGYMATQVDVLRSERVAFRAMNTLQLDDNQALKAAWLRTTGGRGDLRAWLAAMALADLDVKPAKDSNVIHVSYTSPDPVFAAAAANAFVKGYIETTLELQVEPAKLYNNFFDDRAKELRNALEKAQAHLSAYQREKGIIVNDERLDIENSRLAELSSQLVAMQMVAEESGTRQRHAGTHLGQMPEVLSSPLVSGLVTELSRQEARLDELKQRLGDRHPEVLQLKASIDNLNSRIQSETGRIAGSLSVNNSVNQARMTQLRQALDQQRVKLLELKGQRDEAGVLMRDVENAQKAYDTIFARVSQTSTESQNTQTNVSVLKRATVPVYASSPRVSLNLAVGLTLGLLLALGTTIVRELRDQRLRSEEDVAMLLKQPMLGVLPDRSRRKMLGRSHGDLTKLRLLSTVPTLEKVSD